MVLNKRGMFFTLLAIVIISIFITSFIFVSEYEQRKAVSKRVETLNSFVLAVEDDLSRELYASGYRIIFVFESKIFETGDSIDNFDTRVNSLFFSGTYDGAEEKLMRDATFNDIKDNLNEIANKVNANVSFSDVSIGLSQDDSWNVKVTLIADLIIEDDSGLTSWNVPGKVVEVYVPIKNFDDPLYFVEGGVSNKMIQAVSTNFDEINVLRAHAENSYYIASAFGPSFLDRLQGNLNPNANGVESLVNLQELASAKPGVSVVDYTFFSNSPVGGCAVAGMQSWFRLDDGHFATYGGVSCS